MYTVGMGSADTSATLTGVAASRIPPPTDKHARIITRFTIYLRNAKIIKYG